MKLIMNRPYRRSLRKFTLFLGLSTLTLTACGEDKMAGDISNGRSGELSSSIAEQPLVTSGWSGITTAAQSDSSANHKPVAKVASLAEKIRAMPPNTGMLLPSPAVVALDSDLSKGPPPRDYSNRMVYVPKRQTALYLGAGHNKHRRNDVWEYHLASNTWQQLFPSDGGSHALLNDVLHHIIWNEKAIAANGLSPKQQQVIDTAQQWWETNVRLKDGRISTRFGGPLLPFHTWDGVVFDDSVGKLFWAVGASWLPAAKVHALLTGQSLAKVESMLSPGLSTMWSFDPETQQYGQPITTSAGGPDLRGMGSSMVYMPDKQKTLYYAAAANVTPNEFGMYLYNAKLNSWQELKPNGGESIRDLTHKSKVSPRAEAQLAYSAKHQLVFAVRNNDSFVYDLEKNYWQSLSADERIFGHDARSVLVYDEAAEVFLLANPRNDKAPLAEFDPATRRWTVLDTAGDSLASEGKRSGVIGYYDPTFQRFVVRYGRDRVWVYRR